MSYWWGSAGFLFVEVIEDPDTGRSITIIFNTFGQDRDKGGFSCVDIADDTELEEPWVFVFDVVVLFLLHEHPDVGLF